jgi:hypothetical protein
MFGGSAGEGMGIRGSGQDNKVLSGYQPGQVVEQFLILRVLIWI